MRFKRGLNVEVLSKSGGPLGAWICGEIVNGNGRYYTVKYHSNVSSSGEAKLGRVARNSMRPSPPVVCVKRWALGDIVEVRCDIFWKLASIVQAVDEENYLVKLMGYSQELEAHTSDIRPRLVWQDKKWIIIGKGHHIVRSNLGGNDDGENTFHSQYNNDSFRSSLLQSNTFKRASPYRSPLVGSARKKLKVRMQAVRAQPAENIDAVAYPLKNWDDKSSPTGSHERNDSHTIASSVGSCSYPVHCQDTAALSSDADSLCSRGAYNTMFISSSDASLAAARYSLDLRKYRKMLDAFYASGSISWKDEGLLTDLRISLRISDDDHLKELKRLRSQPMAHHII